VERLHDLDDFYDTFSTYITLPAFDPPYYKKETVNCCFDQLTMIICGENYESVILFIMTHHSNIVQRILLRLTCNIYTHNIMEYKAKSLHQYIYFCSKISQELNEKYCDSIATYCIKDIGCTLLNLIKENNGLIAELACKYLYTFFKTVLPKRCIEISNIFDLCIKTLSSFIHNHSDCSIAKEILNFLLKEQSHCFTNEIENLGNLPYVLRLENDHNTESQVISLNF
jgi:hypothetical protein